MTTPWIREIEHARELIGSGLWQAQAEGFDLPTEFEDAWRVLGNALRDNVAKGHWCLDFIAEAFYESGQEIGELVEKRRISAVV